MGRWHRVPAIAYWPNTIAPGETDATVLSMDLLPTLLSLAQVPLSPDFTVDGVDISSLLTQAQPLPERITFWRYRNQSVARQGDWKLLVQQDSIYLFNLANDMMEQYNVAEQYPEQAQSLKDTLQGWEEVMNRIPQRTE